MNYSLGPLTCSSGVACGDDLRHTPLSGLFRPGESLAGHRGLQQGRSIMEYMPIQHRCA